MAWGANDIEQNLAKAKTLIDKGKPSTAIPILRGIIRTNSKLADAHMQLGAALAATAENDKYDEAIAEEKLAIKLDSRSSGAHRILGMIYANQQKLPEAIDLLKEAIRLQPGSFAAHRDLGKAYLAFGKIDEGIASYRKAIEIKPESLDAHLKLALILAKSGKTNDAITEARKAVKMAESKAETHLLLANLLLDSGKSSESIDSFKDAIAANGYDSLGCKSPLTAAGAFSGLGLALVADQNASKEKLNQALAYQKKAIKAYPGFLNAHLRKAAILARLDKPKDAESLYENLFKATKYNAAVGVPYSRFLSDRGRKDDARKVLKSVLEKSPQDEQVKEALAALEQVKTK